MCPVTSKVLQERDANQKYATNAGRLLGPSNKSAGKGQPSWLGFFLHSRLCCILETGMGESDGRLWYKRGEFATPLAKHIQSRLYRHLFTMKLLVSARTFFLPDDYFQLVLKYSNFLFFSPNILISRYSSSLRDAFRHCCSVECAYRYSSPTLFFFPHVRLPSSSSLWPSWPPWPPPPPARMATA